MMVLARKTPLKRTPKKRGKVNATTRADVEFSRLVRDRDGCCVRCGDPNNNQCAHIWSRRYRALRWKMENAITLCQGCHLYFTLRPAEWAEWCEMREFCAKAGVCMIEGQFVPRPFLRIHVHDELFTYMDLRNRALNDPPEKAVDALKRLWGAA